MKFVPDNPACDACDSPATLQVFDSSINATRLFCDAHRPDMTPGKRPELTIKRYRSVPDNPSSRCLAAPENSSEHKSFREEMCDLLILGGEGACRYYLSKLTDSDQFALWQDEFLDNIREYIIFQTDGAAECIPFELNTVDCMAPFMKHLYYNVEETDNEQSKQEVAIVLLLQHPDWTDEQIAESVPTTINQLRRDARYTILRQSIRA